LDTKSDEKFVGKSDEKYKENELKQIKDLINNE
jgi:hypothetical protein